MKKLIASLVVFGVLLTSSTAHALTLSDLQKEVESLKQEIATLRSMMPGQVLGVTASISYSLGMKSTDLIKYQQALIDQKYLASGNATGVFGPLTYTAVKNFQTAKGLKADGVLGSQTQALLLGGQTEVSMTGTCREKIKVLSPNGGEFYQAGSQVTINWSTCDVPLNAQIKIELEAWGNFPAYSFGSTINDGTEVFTLPTTTTLPGMQYGLGYKVAATYIPKTIMFGEPSYYRDFSDNLFTINAMCVSNTWTKKADFGGTLRKNTVGFSIGDKGYVGIGDWNLNAYKDFWEYNSITNTWSQKADFGGVSRRESAQFVIGNKGYVVAGFDAYSNVENHLLKDVWEYNSQTNTWTKKADFGGGYMYDAVGFSIGSKGYVGTGAYLDGWRKDFWEYNPSTDTWTKKADFGGVARYAASGFAIGTKGYIGTGYLQNSDYFKDFWEYNPSTDTWTKKADFGGTARSSALTFTINTKGYLGGGTTVTSGENADFWEYNPSTDTWTKKADLIGSKYLAATFSVGGKGYVATGAWPNGGGTKRVTEYCPD